MNSDDQLDELINSLKNCMERNSLDFVALVGATLYEALGVTKLNANDYEEIKALKAAVERSNLYLYSYVDTNGRDDVESVIVSANKFPPWAQTVCGSIGERIVVLKSDYGLNGAQVGPIT